MTPLDALNSARAAWERTQPQLVIDGWLDGLDAADAGAVRCIEPVAPVQSPLPPGGGLDIQTYDGPDASSCLGARRGQEGA